MVFSSYLFVFYFLPLALLTYYLSRPGLRHFTLTLVSYIFYGWSNPIFVFLMAFSTLVDFTCGRVIGSYPPDRSVYRRAVLAISIATNLGLFGFFKYASFGIQSWNLLAASLGLDWAHWETALEITLPLGISFYTFQSMSYTIDVYRGTAKALRPTPRSTLRGELRCLLDFACYVSMFPQLVAGPIVRFHEVAPQLINRSHTIAKFGRGTAFFCLGFTKKILLANPCGRIADTCFGAGSLGVVDSWYGVIAYAFQIYFDFSGYSDMAVGLGLMLGFRFPRNFDHPYRSESITEFWRRWHQSLSRWLRDYLYLPLGGSRRGRHRTYVNLAIVMLLGGLWHGAAWNFLCWGGFHATLLIAERVRNRRPFFWRAAKPLRVATTFVLVLISWVLFRAPDLASAVTYLASMFSLGVGPPAKRLIGGEIYQPFYLGCVVLAAGLVWGCPDSCEFTRRFSWARAGFCLGLFLVSLAMLTAQSYNPFIYFIF